MKSSKNPEARVLPNSGGESLDKAGIHNEGYLTKKGTPSGAQAQFNYLPPGMNIEEQACTDIREESMKTWSGGLSYPGDGWT